MLKTRCVTISVKQDITEMIEQYGKYAWILHDKDSNPETGELKDAHYHIYLEFPNPRSLNSIAKELDIEPNMIEVVRDKRGILAYLTHSRNPEKYQYEHEEIHSNFEIKRIEESISMIVILKLLNECSTFEEFVSEITHRGLSGNPLHNLSFCFDLWSRKKEVKKYDGVFGEGYVNL